MSHTATSALIRADLPVPFSSGWNRIDGITVNGHQLTITPSAYFFRHDPDVSWVTIPWEKVTADLLPQVETRDTAIEQLALEFVRTHGRTTRDPAEVLHVAHQVYSWLFRPEQLDDPGVAAIAEPRHLVMLREVATLMALNKVTVDGRIASIGPCWFFPAAVRVVYDLSPHEGEALDELYHGGFFNEYRRRESILAHAALGGRLVHGCQSKPDMSGGAVVPYGAPLETFRADLATLKHGWIDQVLSMA
jgi:hypothetical protein